MRIALIVAIAIAVIASVVAYRNAASLGDVQGQLAAQVQELSAKNAAGEDLKAKLAGVSDQLKAATNESNQLKAQKTDLAKQLSDVTTDRDQLKAKGADLTKQFADLSQQLSSTQTERDQLKANAADLADQMKKNQSGQGDLQSKVDTETKHIAALTTEREVGQRKPYWHMEQLTNLGALPPFGFEVMVFPLEIVGASAAPARVVAVVR
jgi:chromosome segregation ATPase